MKIQNITINKYKAFTKKETILIEGKNVFVYGENGSGKSSFYYALKDFFQSSVESIDMSTLRNFTINDGNTDCSIEVEFDGNIKNILNETTKNTNTTQITDANRLKSFLTYKHLLGVHNVKKNHEIDVFDLIINGVLKHFKSASITNGLEFSILWQDLKAESQKEYGKGKPFYYANKKRESVDRKAQRFNEAINKLFLSSSPDYLAPVVNKILNKLSPGLNIVFERRLPVLNYEGKIVHPCKILLEVETEGVSLKDKNPQFSLNEAKLSAIAISIFLGAIIKQSPFSPEIKPLFLDDILIGLDSENRLRLLRLLQEEGVPEQDKVFKDFQIFITTYDRHWYEIAKLHLTGWKFIEFYRGTEGPEIIHNQKNYLEKAKCYFNAYDFPASANYLRKACETTLKDKLLQTYTIGDGVKELVKPPKLETLIDRLKVYYEDLGIQPPEKLVTTLQYYKSILFNPMSHSDIESPIYKHDLELAFKTIEELNSILLPVRTLILKKGTIFNFRLDRINYVAELELAKDVYVVNDNGGKTISPISFYFKKWIREGVEYAKDTGNPPKANTNVDRLTKIKESPYDVAKIVTGMNITCNDCGVANSDEKEVMGNILINGDTLWGIVDKAKQ
ncbi:DNA replication and repair protein RecF [termite gut metagenome]|uniref:DNA replication and repair protein RecF n=1 Tax=termite gut metagenome TaxID=433724 RepID=A0A5J4RYJ5_9ZZZZ